MSVLYGKRIRLRAVEREDINKFYEWVNDPEVTLGLSLFLPLSLREEEKWFEKLLDRSAEERPLAIEMREKNSWRLIGNCGMFNVEWVNRSAELGIMIGDKSMWNQGLGTETMILLLKHGFETLNLHRLFLRVYDDNERAIRAYQKAGFKLEGVMREASFKHGKYSDVHFMSVLRSEWNTREGA